MGWRELLEDKKKLDQLMSLLIFNGATIKRDKKTGEWGYKKRDRHIIPIDWSGIQIEIVPSKLGYEEHAHTRVDMTVGAMYFDLNTLKMLFVEGINASFDLYEKVIRMVRPAKPSFVEDPKRIFRIVRLMAKNNFHLSGECLLALQSIAYDPENLFLTMDFDALCEQLRLILASESLNGKLPEANIRIMSELNLLDKIIEAFQTRPQSGKGQLAPKLRLPFLTRAIPYSEAAKTMMERAALYSYAQPEQTFFMGSTSVKSSFVELPVDPDSYPTPA
jgi:hypothetical protein